MIVNLLEAFPGKLLVSRHKTTPPLLYVKKLTMSVVELVTESTWKNAKTQNLVSIQTQTQTINTHTKTYDTHRQAYCKGVCSIFAACFKYSGIF